MDEQLLSLSELERIEVSRRTDVALSIVPVASAAMKKRKELTDAIQRSAKKSKSYWYWVIGITGLAIHYFVSGDEYKFDAGVWLILATFAHWCGRQFDQHTNQRTLADVKEKISDLQMTWDSVMGNKDDFHRIGEFEIGWRIDWEDDAFADWWATQTNYILMRVCDVEKGLLICAKREYSRDAMKSMKSKSRDVAM